MKRPRKRQTGSVWLRGSSFFFYDTMTSKERKTEFLCREGRGSLQPDLPCGQGPRG